MYTDTCSIQNIDTTLQFGAQTKGTPFTVICRVEQLDRDEKGVTGTRLQYKRLYFLPPGTAITKGDKIKTLTQRGVTVTEAFLAVDEVFSIGGNNPHHMEVTIV